MVCTARPAAAARRVVEQRVARCSCGTGAPSLEGQAKGAVVADAEMGMVNLEIAMDRVRAIPGCRPMVEKALPGEKGPMTFPGAARAVAAYGRTLTTPNRLTSRGGRAR